MMFTVKVMMNDEYCIILSPPSRMVVVHSFSQPERRERRRRGKIVLSVFLVGGG